MNLHTYQVTPVMVATQCEMLLLAFHCVLFVPVFLSELVPVFPFVSFLPL